MLHRNPAIVKNLREAPRRFALVLTGPTASGKSSVAVAIAERTGAVVINADALQVYRELPILTARPHEGRSHARAALSLWNIRRNDRMQRRPLA